MNRDFKHVGGRRTGLLLRRLRTCVGQVKGTEVLSRGVSFKLVSPCGTRMRCLEDGVGMDDFLHPFHDLVAIGAMSNFRKRRQSIVFVDLIHTGRSKRVKFLGSLEEVGITVAHTHVGLIVLKSTIALAGRPFCGELVSFVGGRSCRWSSFCRDPFSRRGRLFWRGRGGRYFLSCVPFLSFTASSSDLKVGGSECSVGQLFLADGRLLIW